MLYIDIPVSRAVKKFLTFKYGKEFYLNRTDWLGILVTTVLSKKRDYYNYKPVQSSYKQEYSYRVVINYAHYEKYGIIFTDAKKKQLSKVLEKTFREYLFEQAIMAKEIYGILYKDTIFNILQFYGIDDSDGYYDAIFRDFTRKKKDLLNKNF